jgi:hypothetical protein
MKATSGELSTLNLAESRQDLLPFNPTVTAFRDQLLQLTMLGIDEGVNLTAFRDPTLPHFRALSSAEQLNILNALNQYVSLLSELKNEEHHIVRNSNSLWRMLGKLKFRPVDDFFSYLSDDDVIEVYDSNC